MKALVLVVALVAAAFGAERAMSAPQYYGCHTTLAAEWLGTEESVEVEQCYLDGPVNPRDIVDDFRTWNASPVTVSVAAFGHVWVDLESTNPDGVERTRIVIINGGAI